MAKDKISVLDGFIRERWANRFSVENYKYIASYYLEKISLNGKRILDIGCGNGLLLSTNALIANPELAVGIDSYKGEGSPLTDYDFILNLHVTLNLPNLKILVGDALRYPLKEKTFDVIFASHFLHHVYISTKRLRYEEEGNLAEILNLLTNIYNSLSDDGVLVVVEVPRFTGLRFGKVLELCKDTDFHTKQEPDDWIHILKRSGFKNFRIVFHTPYPFRRFKRLLSSRILRYLLCGQYYIFAHKS